jgi:hypothetical protein
MMYLLIHFVEELEICSLVCTRWMYPVEHYMKTLKGYVRNKVRPEGSKARRQHGKRLHHRGGMRFLHRIFTRFYSHKMVGVGWQRRHVYGW